MKEIVHSDTAIALGIHIYLRNMSVSVAPLRWAHDLCGPAQTGRAQCAFCAQ